MKKHYKKTSIYKQWLKIKMKYKSIILFQMGDFYELFEADAEIMAPILGLTLTKRDKKDPNSLPIAGFPIRSVNLYIGKILSHGFKVIVCEQEKTCLKNGLVNRVVTKCLTPGTILEHEGLLGDQNNKIISIVLGNLDTSISILDWSTGNFVVKILNRQESIINILENHEIAEILILEKQEVNLVDMLKIFKNKNISTMKKIKNNYIEKLKINNKIINETSSAIIACNLILEYIMDTHFYIPKHVNCIKLENTSNFMNIDSNTLKNIGLINLDNLHKDKSTIFYFFKKNIVTNMGKRYLLNLFKRPLINRNEIKFRQEIIYFFLIYVYIYKSLHYVLL